MSKSYLDFIKQNYGDKKFSHLMKKNKLENYLYYFSLKENVRLDSPTIVGLDITSKCNLSCKHCFIGERGYKDELNTKEIQNLLLTLKDMGTYQVYIMGGEPFCREDIMEIIEFIKSLNMTLSVNTNATLIKKEHCKKLSKMLNNDTDWIQISLDGAKSQTHDFIRNSNVFNIVIDNIKMMAQYNIPIRVNTVVTNINIDELSDIYKLCTQIGVQRINFNPLYPFKRETLFVTPSNKDYIKAFEKVLEVHEKLNKPIFIQQDPICIPYTVEEFKEFFDKSSEIVPTLNCRAGLYSFELDPEGNVYPCTFMHQDKFCAGNIRDEDIKNIWKDDRRWTTILLKRYEGYICEECNFVKKCKGGCMAAAYDCFNDINTPDPRCNLVEY
jgi:radical SAM protein with 4Fe4S-binding SPASM domain